MGLFDTTKTGGIGFAKVVNKQDFTNYDLLDKLSGVKVSFGVPTMGDIRGVESVMYKNVTATHDVFARVDGKNVIMGKIATDGVGTVDTVVNMGWEMMLGHKDANTSEADHAVEELAEVITKLEVGVNVTQSSIVSNTNTSTGKAINLFMKQKAISLKPKFDIYNEYEEPTYHVEGDLTRLNYSVRRSGHEVLKIKKKLVAILPEYNLVADGNSIGKLKKKLKLTAPEIVGSINDKEVKISGDLLAFDYDIVLGDKTIGHVDTAQTLWKDCYRIRIFDERFKDIVAALAIICDNVSDAENNK